MASVAAGLVGTAVSHAPRREGIGDTRLRGRPTPWGQRCCHIRWSRLFRCSLSDFLRGEGRRRPGRSPGQGSRSPGQGRLSACASLCLAEASPAGLGLRAAQGSRPGVAPVAPQRAPVRSAGVAG